MLADPIRASTGVEKWLWGMKLSFMFGTISISTCSRSRRGGGKEVVHMVPFISEVERRVMVGKHYTYTAFLGKEKEEDSHMILRALRTRTTP